MACVIGDGEAETGPLAASWHSNKFLDPRRDGAVLPILHLNGYKIANPAVLARIGDDELTALLRGYGYEPYLVEGDEPEPVHQALAATLDACLDQIAEIQQRSPRGRRRPLPRWPMIVLRTPKGWTGPSEVDGVPVEGTWRAHQVPLSGVRTDAGAPGASWRSGCAATGPRSCSTTTGGRCASCSSRRPAGARRMGSNPHANGGLLTRDLELPDRRGVRRRRCQVPGRGPPSRPGCSAASCGTCSAPNDAVPRTSGSSARTRPSRTGSSAVYEVTGKAWNAEVLPTDEHLAPDGRVMEMLSEHTCQGWLEGYLLTGRHGLFSCYEAFVHIVDSMVNQHAKWLKTINAAALAAADPVAELPAHLARVAAGPQRVLATRTRASSTTW